MRQTTVLLADGNSFVRRAIRSVLDLDGTLQVVGEARNGPQAVIMAKELRPAFVLMDMSIPLLNGFHATRQILEVVPATKVIILSSHGEIEYVDAATHAGAMGYLLKQHSGDTLCAAIRDLQVGNTFCRPSPPSRRPTSRPHSQTHNSLWPQTSCSILGCLG